MGDTPLDHLSHQWRGLQPAPPLRSQPLSCSLQPGPGPSPSLASLLYLSLCNSVGSCPTDQRALARERARERQRTWVVGRRLRKSTRLPRALLPLVPKQEAGGASAKSRVGHSQTRGFAEANAWERKWTPSPQGKGQCWFKTTEAGATSRLPGTGKSTAQEDERRWI